MRNTSTPAVMRPTQSTPASECMQTNQEINNWMNLRLSTDIPLSSSSSSSDDAEREWKPKTPPPFLVSFFDSLIKLLSDSNNNNKSKDDASMQSMPSDPFHTDKSTHTDGNGKSNNTCIQPLDPNKDCIHSNNNTNTTYNYNSTTNTKTSTIYNYTLNSNTNGVANTNSNGNTGSTTIANATPGTSSRTGVNTSHTSINISDNTSNTSRTIAKSTDVSGSIMPASAWNSTDKSNTLYLDSLANLDEMNRVVPINEMKMKEKVNALISLNYSEYPSVCIGVSRQLEADVQVRRSSHPAIHIYSKYNFEVIDESFSFTSSANESKHVYSSYSEPLSRICKDVERNEEAEMEGLINPYSRQKLPTIFIHHCLHTKNNNNNFNNNNDDHRTVICIDTTSLWWPRVVCNLNCRSLEQQNKFACVRINGPLKPTCIDLPY